mmetsp:Transcript_5410/g.10148  ORF Transcript_5410/g.10148 Transcript_5410/m.10148 type:complete len:279 (-) Transcript_5410:99-935(-)
MGAGTPSGPGCANSAWASCAHCTTVDAADWLFCLDTDDHRSQPSKAAATKRKRRAKDSFADQSRDVDPFRLEELTRELFNAHDLNGDGLLSEMELVSLNEKIAVLHHGKRGPEVEEIRGKYHTLFRTKLDPDGHPVPYETFRTYAKGVLEELDKDPEAQEMILEQFVAEAKSGRDAFDLISVASETPRRTLEERLADIPSTREVSRSAGQSPGSGMELDVPLVAGTGYRHAPEPAGDSGTGSLATIGREPRLICLVADAKASAGEQTQVSARLHPDGI